MGDINPAQNASALSTAMSVAIRTHFQWSRKTGSQSAHTLNAELRDRWMFPHTVTHAHKHFPRSEGRMHWDALRATDSHSHTDPHCTTTAVHSFGFLFLRAAHSFGFLMGW